VKNYPQFLAEIDSATDINTKFDMIFDFTVKSPKFNDREFLDLMKRLPEDMNYGAKNSGKIISALEMFGFIGAWKKMELEPTRLYFYWYGMGRIQTLSTANKKEMIDTLSVMMRSTATWFKEQNIDEGFTSAVLRFLIQQHTRVISLPSP